MEFLLCFALAIVFTGGRSVGDIIHAVKGTEPPRVTRARLNAEKRPTPREPSRREGRNYFSTLWHDAWADAKDHHDRARAEKKAGTRPTRPERLKRFGRAVREGVGEPQTLPPPAAATPEPPPQAQADRPSDEAPAPERQPAGKVGDVVCPRCKQTAEEYQGHYWLFCSVRGRNATWHFCCPGNCELGPEDADPSSRPDRQEPEVPKAQTNGGSPVTAPTGEAPTYEMALAELEAQAAEQRSHVDFFNAALAALQETRSNINAVEASYRATAAAAATAAEHFAAKNLDGDTQANAGTVVDAMPPNAVSEMYDRLEEVEVQLRQQLKLAEVALAATEANIVGLQQKYGDSADTVASQLGGDASFLDSGGTRAGDALAALDNTTAAAAATARQQEASDAAWARRAGAGSVRAGYANNAQRSLDGLANTDVLRAEGNPRNTPTTHVTTAS